MSIRIEKVKRERTAALLKRIENYKYIETDETVCTFTLPLSVPEVWWSTLDSKSKEKHFSSQVPTGLKEQAEWSPSLKRDLRCLFLVRKTTRNRDKEREREDGLLRQRSVCRLTCMKRRMIFRKCEHLTVRWDNTVNNKLTWVVTDIHAAFANAFYQRRVTHLNPVYIKDSQQDVLAAGKVAAV